MLIISYFHRCLFEKGGEISLLLLAFSTVHPSYRSPGEKKNMILETREFKKISLFATPGRGLRNIIEMVAPNHSRPNKTQQISLIKQVAIFLPP